jgi:hypothetical protein
MAIAATHTATTVHHRGSEDGPPAPGAGKVRTQRGTCGTKMAVAALLRDTARASVSCAVIMAFSQFSSGTYD